ncbi:hypothetical protein JN11_00683 [Mucilaginibacter frigoritolerans]|jgi:hypothetical protein|uniref:Alpha/beta hydrolase family protein DUF900 n=1 Tax=Mucilaginibacter frigoritolerans TaxID=652788 RepID=A0A562UH57_9SPHI|nr:hypothetical protein [Mucilaginibacter frigoritolerans]TWJ04959.1 hypothetical protein JN11_00683 [Mucilaginibacter frigoritolerans]
MKKLKKNLHLYCPLMVLVMLSSAVSVSAQRPDQQVFWRLVQVKNAPNQKIVRVYLDKFGYFYPDIAVPIDQHAFWLPDGHNSATDTASGNLYHYFKLHPVATKAMLRFYKVNSVGKFNADYYHVQEQLLQKINRQLHGLISNSHAKTIVFLIHGFNETDPTAEYAFFENRVSALGYEKKARPVYIEIFWDGLSTGNDALSFPSVWKHAQNNTRYVGLSVRELMRHLSDRLNFVVVTHSLGASVGTGALFNCTSKWRKYSDPTIDYELDSLSRTITTPNDVTVHLGMLAPAIPGYNTFIDFDNRSPNVIPSQNKISIVSVGYNPNDYATSKYVLAAVMGATTLGCDYHFPRHPDELDQTRRSLSINGYPHPEKLLLPIHFQTPAKFGKQDHAFEAYMQDTLHFNMFLKALFN